MSGRDLRADLVKFKTGAMFKIADDMAARGRYEEAADLYLKLVAENPANQFADSALNNAAVAYEKVKRFDSASKLYERLVREYPRSSLADDALFRVGLNAERFFNFDKAIAAYLDLVKRYPKSASAADATYNAALSMENLQDYARSAEQYQRYCKLFPKRDDAPQVCFRAGLVYEKMGQPKKVIATYQEFIRKYHNDVKNRDRVIEAHLRIAKAFEKQNQPGKAQQAYAQTVQAYKQSGADPKSGPYAAEAQFQLIDAERKRFSALKITGNSKAQKAALVKKATQLKSVQEHYEAVLKFKQVDWTLASLFRIGQLYQDFSEALIAAPCPPDVKKAAARAGATTDEICDAYRMEIEDKSAGIEDKAVQAYETTINKARELQVINAWTKQTLVALNKLRRAQYPLQKDAMTFVDVLAIGAPDPVRDLDHPTPTHALPAAKVAPVGGH